MSNVVPINLNQEAAKVLEKVVVEGDLSRLSPAERLFYYQKVCESVGLNPLTRPFEYIYLNNKLVLYAKKDATDQLRKIHGISVTITSREKVGDVYVVTAKARTQDGREDEAIGAVPLMKREMKWDPSKGKNVPTGKMVPLDAEELANALMKAESKAKRRVTLSIAGLGMLDETELETIQDVQPFHEESQPSPSVVEMKPKEKEKPAAPENPAQQAQTEPAGKSANPDDSGNPDAQEFTLLNIDTGTSKSGEPYVKIFVKELRYPILARGEGLEEAAKIEGGEGSRIVLETFREGNFTFLKRVIDGGSSPAQPEPAADGTGHEDETATGTAQEDAKRYILGKSQEGKTGNGTPFVRFIATDTSTGENLTVIARGADKVELFRTIPKDGTPFGLKVTEENGFLFLEEVLL